MLRNVIALVSSIQLVTGRLTWQGMQSYPELSIERAGESFDMVVGIASYCKDF